MKAITIWQPWATLIALGAKPYEFRKWAAPKSLVGQRIAIHAGARKVVAGEVADLMARLRTDPIGYGAEALGELERRRTDSYPRACVLGTAVLGTPQRCTELFAADSDRLDHHMWAWPLSQFVWLQPPVAMRGAQGFWSFTP